MARNINRLSTRTASSISVAGYHPDGGGLYLQVSAAGAKSWIFRFTIHGRAREMGLGSTMTISLAAARIKAQECRILLQDRVDPIEARKTQRAEGRLAAARSQSFSDCAAAYIEVHRAGWRNAKHADQWTNTIKTYAAPFLGDRSVQSIDTALVMKVLEPIWESKTETASRVRGRIEAVLDWAAVRGLRRGENPARWRGHLDHLLPERAKVQRVIHHPALPYDQMGRFMLSLRAEEGVAARGLEFQILAAARTGEVIGARWDEFDDDKRLWTVPAVRMKAQREHRVPLSARAIAILAAQRAVSQSEFVFPGMRPPKPLSNMAFLQLLKRMKQADVTAHGFRSSFRDWAAEQTAYPSEAVEMALAHSISDKVEAAYRRGDLFEKRRELMEDWARHCDVPIQPKRPPSPGQAATT